MKPERIDPHADSAAQVLADRGRARLWPWGLLDYGEVLTRQQALHRARREGHAPDTWLAGEHPPVITQGVRGRREDLVAAGGLPVVKIDRGGMTTIHNPGQLVIYPIVRTRSGLLAQARMSRTLLETTRRWLAALLGIELETPRGRPGLFREGRKAAAIGISIHGHVTMHGIAVNCCNDLTPWRSIVPCGEPSTRPVTLSELVGRRIEPAELIGRLPDWLKHEWGYETVWTIGDPAGGD